MRGPKRLQAPSQQEVVAILGEWRPHKFHVLKCCGCFLIMSAFNSDLNRSMQHMRLI